MIRVSAHTARMIFTAAFVATVSFAPGLRANAAPPAKPAPKAPAAAPKPAVKAPAAGGASHPAGAAGAHTTTTTTSHTTTTGARGATTTTTSRTTTTTGGRPTTAGGFGGARPGAAGGRPGGIAGAHGNLAHAGPAGSHDRVGSHGEMVRTRANGRPMDVHTRGGMDIHHNLGGGRRIERDRPGGGRMVYERGRPGYISHPYGFRGHDYYRRSYYYNGRSYDRFYNHYGYRGVYLDVYSPARFYGVGFYGWAYNPWVRPVPYAWGWGAAPWYGYYGAYFTPYPVYAAPAFWLTDYLIAQSLQSSYEARQAAAADAAAQGGAPPAPMSAEDKQMIVNEVKAQIALENAEAQANAQGQVADASGSSIARMLSDGQPHVFIPGKEVDLVDTNGQECAVTDGDVLQLTTPPPAAATAATLTVIASKGGVECRKGVQVSVAFDDLQEMHNHMRETLDTGLQELQAKQGQGGLPPAPGSATGAPVTAAVAENAPPPDPAGAQELAQQAQEADKSEQEALGATAGAAGSGDVAAAAAPAPVATATISLGQSTDDVKAALGQPVRIINLGPKTIYQYKDMKITFKAGKVSDVE